MYGHAAVLCENAQKINPNDLFLSLWQAFALIRIGDYENGFENIQKLECREDLQILYMVAMFFFHKEKGENKNINELIEIGKKSNNFAISQSSKVCLLFKDYDLMEKLIDNRDNNYYRSLKAWMHLIKGDLQNASDIFKTIDSNYMDLFSNYGRSLLLLEMNMRGEGIELLNTLIIKYSFPELVFDIARFYIRNHSYDLASMLFTDYPNNLFSRFEYNLFKSILCILHQGDKFGAKENIKMMISHLLNIEKKNWKFLSMVSYFFLSITHGDLELLSILMPLVMVFDELSECGSICFSIRSIYQLYLSDYVLAHESANKCIYINPKDSLASECFLKISIKTGNLKEAIDQIEIIGKMDINEIAYLSLCQRVFVDKNSQIIYKNQVIDEIARLMNSRMTFNPSIFEIHLLEIVNESYFSWLSSLRLDVIVESLQYILVDHNGIQNIPIEPIFNFFCENFPGIIVFKEMYGKYLENMRLFDKALYIFKEILISKWDFQLNEVLLSLSSIYFEQNNLFESQYYLELYKKNKISLVKQDKFLVMQFKLDYSLNNIIKLDNRLSDLFEQLSSFFYWFQLLDFFYLKKNFKEMKFIISKMKDFPMKRYDKTRVLLYKVLYFASQNALAKAFVILNNLKTSGKYMNECNEVEYKLYLNHVENSSKLNSLNELVYNNDKSSQSCVRLSEAYYLCCLFDESEIILEKFLEENGYDNNVCNSLMCFYFRFHNYDKLTNMFNKFQKDILKSLLHFSSIYIKLYKIYSKNEIQQFLDINLPFIRNINIMFYIDVMYKYAEEKFCANSLDDALKLYTECMVIFNEVVTFPYYDIAVKGVLKLASCISYRLGIIHQKRGNMDLATEHFSKSIGFDEDNVDPVISLYSIYKSQGNTQQSVNICSLFLDKHPSNHVIALLITESDSIVLKKSIHVLRNVINLSNSINPSILIRLIELSSRAGKLKKLASFLDNIPKHDHGVLFSFALFKYLSNNIFEAIGLFNQTQKSPKWCSQSYEILFRIYTNPDKKRIWKDVDPLACSDFIDKAMKIINKIASDPQQTLILKAEVNMSLNTDLTITEAISQLREALQFTSNFQYIYMSLAKCYLRLNNLDNADKFIEKALVGKPYHDTFHIYEESYLMRAEICLRKLDPRSSQHYTILALGINNNCRTGWEMLSSCQIKQKQYNEASESLRELWDQCNKENPDIGYKYAYCLMKSGKVDEAIIICRAFLSSHPLHQEIRDRVLVPSYKLLKP